MKLAGMSSGRGSNVLRLHDRSVAGASLCVVLSDDPAAPALERAEERGVPTRVLSSGESAADALSDHDADLVCLDGFEPGLPGTVLDDLPTTLDVHASLSPPFDDQNPVEDALDAGLRVTGATVTVVGSDSAVVTQEPVPIYADDTVETLEARIRDEGSFRAYARAIRWFADGRVAVENGAVSVEGDEGGPFPLRRSASEEREATLRYGENPHQEAAVYADPTSDEASVASAPQVGGEKGMSYVNYIDAAGGLDLAKEFERPAAAVIKHANPAGCATADSLANAYDRALSTDPKSAFGGVVALNRQCDVETAERIVDSVKHVVVAPGYADGVLDVLGEREKMRVLDVSGPTGARAVGPDDRTQAVIDQPVPGGRLVQDRDRHRLGADDLEVVTEREPTDEQLETMLFAWRVCKHVTSNAIVFADGTETVGLGVGQVSRVDAIDLARRKGETDAEGKSPEGAVMASDAFMPFADNIEAADDAGIDAVIQPGGSIRDDEVIEAADERGMSMVFTGHRAFRHD